MLCVRRSGFSLPEHPHGRGGKRAALRGCHCPCPPANPESYLNLVLYQIKQIKLFTTEGTETQRTAGCFDFPVPQCPCGETIQIDFTADAVTELLNRALNSIFFAKLFIAALSGGPCVSAWNTYSQELKADMESECSTVYRSGG
jgi:hypothetical protein